jgi:hypothetical protein
MTWNYIGSVVFLFISASVGLFVGRIVLGIVNTVLHPAHRVVATGVVVLFAESAEYFFSVGILFLLAGAGFLALIRFGVPLLQR